MSAPLDVDERWRRGCRDRLRWWRWCRAGRPGARGSRRTRTSRCPDPIPNRRRASKRACVVALRLLPLWCSCRQPQDFGDAIVLPLTLFETGGVGVGGDGGGGGGGVGGGVGGGGVGGVGVGGD